MTLKEWRDNEELRTWVWTLVQSGQWKLLMEALDDSHVRHFQIPHAAHDTACVRQLGRIEGWDTLLSTLRSATQPNPAQPTIEATFEKPE